MYALYKLRADELDNVAHGRELEVVELDDLP